jgi:hypothetical protein
MKATGFRILNNNFSQSLMGQVSRSPYSLMRMETDPSEILTALRAIFRVEAYFP